MTHLMCYVSHVTHQMSRVSLILVVVVNVSIKGEKIYIYIYYLVSGGSVINGATPSSFKQGGKKLVLAD